MALLTLIADNNKKRFQINIHSIILLHLGNDPIPVLRVMSDTKRIIETWKHIPNIRAKEMKPTYVRALNI